MLSGLSRESRKQLWPHQAKAITFAIPGSTKENSGKHGIVRTRSYLKQ
jgi:hypothetical protein